jgi:hypothetical protein
MNRFSRFLTTSFLAALLGPLAALAQSRTSVPLPANYGPSNNDYEFTMGANGLSNKNLDNSTGGLSFSIGKYINDTFLTSIRQTVSYNSPSTGSSSWNGSTLFAFDEHFGRGFLSPFVGLNFGGLYGQQVHDSWSAGLETGLKYYVKPHTFIFGLLQYEWLFNKGSEIKSSFSDGQFIWSAGVGFTF